MLSKLQKWLQLLDSKTRNRTTYFLKSILTLQRKWPNSKKQKYADYYFNLVTDLSGMVQREFANKDIDMVKFQSFFKTTEKLKKLVNDAPYSASIDPDNMDVVEDMIKRLNF